MDAALAVALRNATALGPVPELPVAAHAVVPAVVLAFDQNWFEGLANGVRTRLFALAVTYAEMSGRGLGEVYNYALAHPRLFSSEPGSLASFFGVAVLAGDFETARALAAAAQGDLQPLLSAALAVATGAFSKEYPFTPPKKDEHVGVARILQALSLLGRGRAEDLIAVDRVVRAGYRKNAAFRASCGWLKELLELTQGTRTAFLKRAFESDGPWAPDCLSGVIRATFAIWADDASVELAAQVSTERFAEHFGEARQLWLTGQYRACAERLARMQPSLRSSSLFGAASTPERAKASSAEEPTLSIRAVFELRTAKEPWELSLETLERVAAKVGPTPEGTPADAVQERILWRFAAQSRHRAVPAGEPGRSFFAWSQARN